MLDGDVRTYTKIMETIRSSYRLNAMGLRLPSTVGKFDLKFFYDKKEIAVAVRDCKRLLIVKLRRCVYNKAWAKKNFWRVNFYGFFYCYLPR